MPKISKKNIHDISTIMKDGEEYIPMVRVAGEIDQPDHLREYYLFAVVPPIPAPFSLESLKGMLDIVHKSAPNIKGIVLIDSITHIVRPLTKDDINDYNKRLKTWRKTRNDRT